MRGGEVGRAAIWRNQLSECYFQKALHRLRPKKGYDVRLMLALLEYRASTGGFANYVTQTSIAHLPRDKFIQMPIPLPSLSEQWRLGDLFDDLNGCIDTLQRLVVKKQAVKQGLMQQLLTGRMRFPGFTAPWRTTNLGSVVTLQRGFDLPSRLRRRGAVPIVSSSGASGWHDRVMVKAPGVVTGRYGTIGEVFFQSVDFWPLNTTLWVSDFHGNDERFIFYMLHRVDFATHSGKSGVPGVNRNDLHANPVTLPVSIDEQRAIADALSTVDHQVENLERMIAKKEALKKGAMQELLTGRSRLPVQGESDV
ncbi:restriction endonuclease subunit S [Streptomyces sp. Cmuel-A718b]|uniref:restriction endonuclease subunit S n=1 Tax=Streptomyces sp. Cmuel-A718b TaxID=697328 RepID=UPI00081E75DF|nr:restriction endonuclease subunit S [Streptomyces sp. Cmuel-A718b]SCF88647.1 Restriction endonuclease S subunit [Streptomyces sp. Cmuel-A718b]